jgi:hypothetical protein
MQKFSTMNAHGFRVAARCVPDRSHYSQGSLGRSPGVSFGAVAKVTLPFGSGAQMLPTGRRLVRIGGIVGRVPVRWAFVHRQRMGFLAPACPRL